MATVTTNSRHYTDIADAIRAKGVNGSFHPSQMASAIAGISAGTDYLASSYYTIKSKLVTIGANTVSNPQQAAQYFSAAVGSNIGVIGWALANSEYSSLNNQSIAHLYYYDAASGNPSKFYYRIRNGTISTFDHTSGYDVRLAEGSKYRVFYIDRLCVPAL